MKVKVLWLIPAVLAAGLAGCSKQGNYTDNSAINNYAVHSGNGVQNTTRAYQTKQLYGNVIHDNSHLYYNQYLSDQISALYGIQSAIVMTTDKNAYVAILLDNSGLGTTRSAVQKETNNSGTATGIYNPHAPGVDGVPSSYIATGVNSYSTVHNHNELSHAVKQKIATKIRALQPSLLDVYISANRDFINGFTRLAQESWKGNSLDPHIGEFNKLVTNVFGTEQWTMNE
jgi:hypothetical protein